MNVAFSQTLMRLGSTPFKTFQNPLKTFQILSNSSLNVSFWSLFGAEGAAPQAPPDLKITMVIFKNIW